MDFSVEEIKETNRLLNKIQLNLDEKEHIYA